MKKFNIILKETYFRNVKSGSFLFMLILPVLIAMIGTVVMDYMKASTQDSEKQTVAIVSTEKQITDTLQQELTLNLKPMNEQQAITALNQDDVAGILTLKRNANQLDATYQYKATSSAVNLNKLSAVLTAIQVQLLAIQENVSPQTLQTLLNTKVDVISQQVDSEALKNGQILSNANQSQKNMVRSMVALIAVSVIYVFIVFYGNLIGQEVASEKGTRVMEVILSSTDAKTHFLGKIIGITLVILTQLIAYLAIGVGYVLFTGYQWLQELKILELAGSMLVYTLLFIIIGGFLYVVISALCGSVATKIEDVQKVLMPILMFDIIGFYIGMFAQSMPNAQLVRWASWIPLFTPLIMPFRVAAETVSSLELILTIIGMILFTFITFKVALSFYQANVLIYSDKGVWQVLKQAWQLNRRKK